MEENTPKENALTSVPDISGIADEFQGRKKKILGFFKKKWQLVSYLILAFIVFIGVFVRTRNISKLKDITTGTWTLGPDLDPFLFLRWAKYIAEHGRLFLIDKMRYVPLSEICSGGDCFPVNTSGEMRLLSYFIAWFYKFLSVFKETTVTYAAVILPVVLFALTIVAFFLFARKVFYKKDEKTRNIIALISTAFFALAPSLLPRTIAGIPEKESAGFLFIFLSLYFFIEAFTTEKLKRGLIFGLLAGITTGVLALVWGGVEYVLMSVAGAVFFAFLIGKIDFKKFCSFGLWIFGFMLIAIPFSMRYTPMSLLASTSSGLVYMIFFIIGIDLLIFEKKIFKLNEKIKIKLPRQVISLIISLIILSILGSIFLGISFIPHKITDIIDNTVHPLSLGRFSVTVAENKQPDFVSEWKGDFGPVLFNIPIYFWLFFIGSGILFLNLIEKLEKKEKRIPILTYFIFLTGLIFSRYSPSFFPNTAQYKMEFIFQYLYFFMFLFLLIFTIYSIIKLEKKFARYALITPLIVLSVCVLFYLLSGGKNSNFLFNGESAISLIVYFGGILIFLGSLVYVYYKRHRENKSSVFKEFEFSYILYFIILTMTIIGARGTVRLIMVLGAISPLAAGFLVSKIPENYLKEKEDTKRLVLGILAVIIIIAAIFTLVRYYQDDKSSGENYAPGAYQWQWQKAMAWVRENTSENSVFAHWWDYGYWIQSIGERATILDGGNALGYWNHMMGRYVLTGGDKETALGFLYAHNGTHLLIDSTDIGKYAAFSSIGSDENYDRYTSMNTLLMDTKQTQETANGTIYVYPAGFMTDEDIVWNENGKEILLPRKKAGVLGILVRETTDKQILQPEAIFAYNNLQYRIPLKYAYVNGKLYSFGSGVDAGVFVFPKLDSTSSGITSNPVGAMIYLSPRVINSYVARIYLFGEEPDYFKLAHVESSAFVDDLQSQGFYAGEFVYFQGFQGPIKIWEIKYPSDIKLNTDYLKTDYPPEIAGVNPEEY